MSKMILQTVQDYTTAKQVDAKYLTDGTAKVWVNLSQDTSPASARGSFNVASITDVGVGITVTNLSSAFANANYAASMTSGFKNGQDAGTVAGPDEDNPPTTTTIRTTVFPNGSGVRADSALVYVVAYGDLA